MNTHKTVILQTTQRAFTFFRMLRLLLNLTLMSLSACSTTATRYDNASNMPEQSRIHVEPFSKYDDVSPATADAAGLMTRIITEQLAMENRLQTALDSESLILYGAILSFEDAMLDVQGELYAGEEFVAYSRIKRQVKQPEQMANRQVIPKTIAITNIGDGGDKGRTSLATIRRSIGIVMSNQRTCPD